MQRRGRLDTARIPGSARPNHPASPPPQPPTNPTPTPPPRKNQPQVGKTSLIQALVKHYTKQGLGDPRGPVTLVAGKKRRITLLECPPDLPGARGEGGGRKGARGGLGGALGACWLGP
jgi:hypothetical protein